MKNSIKPILIVLLISSIILNIFFVCKYFDNKYIITNPLEKGNLLSIMLQKDENSDEYEKSQTSKWPEQGYLFNPYLSNCENGSKLAWRNDKVVVNTKTSDKCYVYFDKYNLVKQCEYENLDTAVCKIANTYNTDKTLLYHNGTITDDTGNILDANDKSYRYSGASEIVNNYVCIDSKTKGTCDNNDLYRIIGLFKNNKDEYEIKLIKSDYATEVQLGTEGARKSGSNYSKSNSYKGKLDTIPRYYWTDNTNHANLWKGSALNTENINKKFLAYLEQQKPGITDEKTSPITNHDWIIAGNTSGNIARKYINEAYVNEILKPEGGTLAGYKDNMDKIYSAKIGLMYVSDYGYAASQESWMKQILYEYKQTIDNNWMHMGLYEWTITRQADTADCVFFVHSTGNADYLGDVYSDNYAVRPSFYLSSDTKFSSGDGTLDTPYRINVENEKTE